ncbi:hypothetical protein QTG87_09845 [Clostridium perfringens]|nr:hypothetical protein [Clostridium perfringens]
MKKDLKEILLITTRNILENTGEYKLIRRRAEELRIKGFITKVFCIQKKSRVNNIKSDLYKNECFDVINLTGYKNSNLIIEIIKFRSCLKKYLYENNPKYILVSGIDFMFFDIVKKYKKDKGCKIIYDIHGCPEEILEYNFKSINKYILNLFFKFFKLSLKIGIKSSDVILLVSKEMKRYIENEFSIYSKKVIIIPCGEEGEVSGLKERMELRKLWREKLKLNNEDIVLVYSGGISQWQMIDETLIKMREIIKQSKKIKVCIFSGQIDIIKDKVKKDKYIDQYIFKKLDNIDVTKALCACDIGFILRENNMTNRVAFPNKFSDYIEGGLQIVLSGVNDQIDLINRYSLGVAKLDINDIEVNDVLKLIENRESYLYEYYKKIDFFIKSELKYEKNINKLTEYILE